MTTRAESDLDAIGEYVACDNPLQAISFLKQVRLRCQKVADAPKAYPLAPEFGVSVRKIAYKNYLILYTIDGDMIHIRHIRHAARQRREIH